MPTRLDDILRPARRHRRRLAGAAACLAAILPALAVAVIVSTAGTHRIVPADAQIEPATENRVDRETGGRLVTEQFFSRALRRRADYIVYLPPGFSRSEGLPAFYLLHGMPGRPMAFTLNAGIERRMAGLLAAGRVAPMILVFPDGRIDGRTHSDSEWANTPSGDYESYVSNVVASVDARFGALACRAERAIAGLSAGAYGAANIGLHQVGMFGLVQVWSGYFTETHNGVFARASAATMAYDSPIDYVQGMRSVLARDPLRIFLYVGRHDPYHDQIAAMAAALQAVGAHESWAIYPGGHSWKTWVPHVDQMLIMASHDFTHPLNHASPKCTA